MKARHRNVSVTQARKELGDLFAEVNYKKERILLTNRKKCIAIVPLEDLEKLEAMEDNEDIHQAQLALEEKGSISFEEMKKSLS